MLRFNKTQSTTIPKKIAQRPKPRQHGIRRGGHHAGAAEIGEGLAFQPIESTGTDQTTNTEFTGGTGRVVEDQVTISAEARSAFEEAQAGASRDATPAQAALEEATNPAQNLAFRNDSAQEAADD